MRCLLKRVSLFLFLSILIGNVSFKALTFQALSPHTLLTPGQTDFKEEGEEKWRKAVRLRTQHYRFLDQYEKGGFLISNPKDPLPHNMKSRINYYLLMLPANANYKAFLHFVFANFVKLKTPEEAKNLFADKTDLTIAERIAKKLLELAWITDGRDERPKEERFQITEYIYGSEKIFMTNDEFFEVYVSAMEQVEDRPYFYRLVGDGDYLFGEIFLDRLFEQIPEEAQPGDHPAPGVEVMLHLIHNGVPLALLPEVLHEFLNLSYLVFLKEKRQGDHIFMSATVPFQLFQAALEHNPRLATDAPLLKCIEKYRGILRQYENKKEYAFTLEHARRAYHNLQEQLLRHALPTIEVRSETNSSI